VLIAEVLSPSSAKDDLGAKAADYVRLPSLSVYLALAQEEAKVWVWMRGEDGFSPTPQIVAGGDALIQIPALGIELPLAEIYTGLKPR
jgi:Uma2 family endonuclease